jgi:protein-S-isoprenylcysteine O-methyltransferase Ste14
VADIAAVIARWRVRAGFACGMVALWLARPDLYTLGLGSFVACIGELLRVWAAGHLEKGREVTQSGPYAFVRHPLYLGSGVIAVGMAIATASLAAAALVLGYVAITTVAAIRTEEAWLRAKFGTEYDAYVRSRGAPVSRSFSLSRAMANRECRAVAGLVLVMGLLALKL